MMGLVKVTYGENIAYVELGKGKVARTTEVAPGLLLDVDENGEALGLEIMGLERRGLPLGMVQVEVATGTVEVGENVQRLAPAMLGGGQAQAR